jgi:serine/threonine protein phosphatase 1
MEGLNLQLTYAIPDLHGMLSMLVRALKEIDRDAAGRSRKIVFLGDYVDRGPDSRGIVDLLRSGPSSSMETWVNLRGNHDQWLIDGVRGDAKARKDSIANGAYETYRQYMRSRRDVDWDSLRRDVDLLDGFAHHHDDGHRFFVHAGAMPGVALESQDPFDLMWIRDEFLESDHDFGRVIVHGHTIQRTPTILHNRVSIDTGAYDEEGCLTIAVFEADPFPVRLISIAHPTTMGLMDVTYMASSGPTERPVRIRSAKRRFVSRNASLREVSGSDADSASPVTEA